MWCASWQDGQAVSDFDGSYSEVLAWAMRQPAGARLIFDAEIDDYRPL